MSCDCAAAVISALDSIATAIYFIGGAIAVGLATSIASRR